MVTSLYEATRTQISDHDGCWLFYTDIYQRYQFRYPSSWTVTRQGENVYLNFEQAGKTGPLPASWADGRFIIYKPQPFHDLINLEEYLQFQDRQYGFPYAGPRYPIAGLMPGYRGIREIGDSAGGMILSLIYICFQTRIVPIHAVIPDGRDLDIKLARSVRFL